MYFEEIYMKRLLVIIVLSVTLLFSCTKPLDNIVILNVKDKATSSLDTTLQITYPTVTTTTLSHPNVTAQPSTTTLPLTTTSTAHADERVLVINKSSKKVHLSEECSYAGKISEKNKVISSYDQLYEYLENGYEICSYCEKHY